MTTRPGPAQPALGWVLYDGDCGVCSRWVSRSQPTLARLGLAIAPLQSTWVEKATRLSQEVLLTDIRLFLKDGTLVSGANVYRYVLRRLWWSYPLYLLSVTPGLRTVFDWGYRTIAQHRMRISSTCAAPGRAGKVGR